MGASSARARGRHSSRRIRVIRRVRSAWCGGRTRPGSSELTHRTLSPPPPGWGRVPTRARGCRREAQPRRSPYVLYRYRKQRLPHLLRACHGKQRTTSGTASRTCGTPDHASTHGWEHDGLSTGSAAPCRPRGCARRSVHHMEFHGNRCDCQPGDGEAVSVFSFPGNWLRHVASFSAHAFQVTGVPTPQHSTRWRRE